MKITVISMWHNEAQLAPFFLGHYAYADKIRLIIGKDTTDNTLEICARYPNVEIEEYTFPGGLLDDILKMEIFNQIAATEDSDWIMTLDADEFIFPSTREDPREYLSRQKGNLLQAVMWQVYRHSSESDLDPNKPALEQRQHGNTSKAHHTKPVILKPEIHIQWSIGHHGRMKNPDIVESQDVFWGAHWAMADVDMAVARYIRGRKGRLSKRNIIRGFGIHCTNYTEDRIRAECAEHLQDKKLF